MTDWLIAALPAIQFWQLELHLWTLAALAIWQAPALVRSVGARPPTWIALVACGALAWWLSAMVAPRTSRIYYDEQIYQHIGQSLADRHRAEMCNEGTVGDGRLTCVRAEYNKQPNAYPHLVSLGFRIAGANDQWAFTVNNLAAAFLPIVVFLLSVLIWPSDGRAPASALPALIAALIPQQLLWSNTAAAEATAALSAAFAVVAAAWFVRARSSASLALTVVAASYAAQFRPESPLIIPVVASVVLLGAADELRRRRLWVAVGGGVVLIVPLLMHLWAVSGHGWGTPGPRAGAAFVWGNLAVNGPFYITNVRFPALVTVFACAALVRYAVHRVVWVLAAYFVVFFAVFLSFYAGSYDYGADVRYSLLTYPPLLALAGIGATWMACTVGRGGVLAAAVVIILQFTWFLPLVRAVGEEAWAARADVAAAQGFALSLPANAIVLTHNPSLFLLRGRSAAQMSLASTDPGYVERLAARFDGGVYLHWNFWCNVPDPLQAGFCTAMTDRFDLELVQESRTRDFRYALYRVLPR